MSHQSRRRSPVLVITPATRFGSWAWLEKVIEAAGTEVEWIVVSYGRPPYELANVEFRTLPALVDYAPLGRLLSRRGLLWLNAAYLLPLAPLAWWCAIRYRTGVIVANGVVSAAIASPLRLLGRRLFLAYHGALGHSPRVIKRMLRLCLGGFEGAFVNSTGSADDLTLVYDRARIQVVHLWADDRFFAVPLARPGSDRLRVLFVGRQDPEKFAQCLRVCTSLAAEGTVSLRAVGAGPLAEQVVGYGVEQLGYIADVDELAEVYATSDVVWAPADTTYVSIPGAEALAAGCRVIVSDIPAVEVKAAAGDRVARDLLPSEIGAVVDGATDDEAAALLRRWSADGISLETREHCRSYAAEHHSSANLRIITDAITSAA
jgi:glycosyltransferase involved in cell wall biosynthesis